MAKKLIAVILVAMMLLRPESAAFAAENILGNIKDGVSDFKDNHTVEVELYKLKSGTLEKLKAKNGKKLELQPKSEYLVRFKTSQLIQNKPKGNFNVRISGKIPKGQTGSLILTSIDTKNLLAYANKVNFSATEDLKVCVLGSRPFRRKSELCKSVVDSGDIWFWIYTGTKKNSVKVGQTAKQTLSSNSYELNCMVTVAKLRIDLDDVTVPVPVPKF